MKRLLGYLKNYRFRALLAPLFKMLEASFELMVPLVMIKLIDIGITNKDKDFIISCGIVLVALTVVGYIASITAQFFAAKAAMQVGKELRRNLFRHINSLSYDNLDKAGTSSLITRMTSDVNHVVAGVNMFLRLFLRSPFIIIGAVVMAFTVDVKTSVVFLIVLPLLIGVVFAITFISIPMYKNVQNDLDNVTLLTRESLIGIRVIRAFNRQKIEEAEFDKSIDRLKTSQLRVGRLSALMNPITYMIINFGIAALIYFGALRVDIGDMTQGQVVALVNYMSQVLVEVVKLANLIILLTKAVASTKRINDIFDMEPGIRFENTETGYSSVNTQEASGATRDSEAEIVFENVSLSYGGAKEHAISDISFSARRGETIGIIGGTGSGKTTLVNIIPRLYEISSGSVRIDGKDIKQYSKEGLRSKVGIVPQSSVLFKGTIADNLRMADSNASDEMIEKALEISQSAEFVDQKTGRTAFKIEQGGKNLSGGQRQRLCIARALTRNPEILILDDSSSALDFATESKLLRALRATGDERTTIIVSQRASSIMHADKIIVMDDGRAVAIGTHDELYNSCELYREIYHTQFKERGGKVYA